MGADLMISKYDMIRNMLRDIYIYGCFSKEDFLEMGIGKRNFDNYKSRIWSYLPDGFIDKKIVNKKDILYCKYNMFDKVNNYLAETYRYCSYRKDDIKIEFNIIKILAEGEDKDINFLSEELSKVIGKISPRKIRRRLAELKETGYVDIVNGKYKNKYKLKENILDKFNKNELLSIYRMLELYGNISVMEMPYYFAKEKVKRYLEIEDNNSYKNSEESIFLYKHNHVFNLIDNETLYKILNAIEMEKIITFKIDFRNNKMFFEDDNFNESKNEDDKEKRNEIDGNLFHEKSIDKEEYIEQTVIPIKIIHECTYGRQYLVGYSLKDEKIFIFRLDRITELNMLEKDKEDDILGNNNKNEILNIARKEAEKENDCWCTAGITNDLTKVKIEFSFDEKYEGYILKRLNNECKIGKLEKISEGQYIYEVEVRSANEMIPWIRSFGERAKVIEGGAGNIDYEIKKDWNNILEKYESKEWENILEKYKEYK